MTTIGASTLRDFADLAARLPDVDFDHLIERAERQRADLERFRARAGIEALAASAELTRAEPAR